ncbi:hypothetical protein [Deinococcus alpinitundrae]|nr:hypothetical protein [Deinococcus alpinitundrae]
MTSWPALLAARRRAQAALITHDDETAVGLLETWLLALASGKQAARDQ